MAKLKTPAAVEAWDEVMQWAPSTDPDLFQKDVDTLIGCVQDETELAHMRGRVRFLGEPYMLYRALESVVGQERRPVHRDAAIQAISDALSKYLGLKFIPSKQKRKRKGLLSHV